MKLASYFAFKILYSSDFLTTELSHHIIREHSINLLFKFLDIECVNIQRLSESELDKLKYLNLIILDLQDTYKHKPFTFARKINSIKYLSHYLTEQDWQEIYEHCQPI
jgi:hypothetical protein